MFKKRFIYFSRQRRGSEVNDNIKTTICLYLLPDRWKLNLIFIWTRSCLTFKCKDVMCPVQHYVLIYIVIVTRKCLWPILNQADNIISIFSFSIAFASPVIFFFYYLNLINVFYLFYFLVLNSTWSYVYVLGTGKAPNWN